MKTLNSQINLLSQWINSKISSKKFRTKIAGLAKNVAQILEKNEESKSDIPHAPGSNTEKIKHEKIKNPPLGNPGYS